MKRAVVLVGVHKTGGGLEPLRAVGECISSMKAWAFNQGIPSSLIASFTDLGGEPVTAPPILDAIRRFGEQGVEKLVIYFAGHGFGTHRGDYWLLSDAPEDGNAAVNVEGSQLNAKRYVIPHVVFISDACRTAPQTIREGAVTGSVIFPNRDPRGQAKSTDLFPSALLGEPAYEIRIGATYRSIFTEAIVDALNGKYPEILSVDEDGASVLKANSLKLFLPGEVTRRIQEIGSELPDDMCPDPAVSSDPPYWIAVFSAPAQLSKGPSAYLPDRHLPDRPDPRSGSIGPYATISDRFTRRVNSILHDRIPEGTQIRRFSEKLVEYQEGIQESSGVSGLEIHGQTVRSVQDHLGISIRISANFVGLTVQQEEPTCVLVEMDSGKGVYLPVFPEYLGRLSFTESGLLRHLWYEPVRNTANWTPFQEKAVQLRALRIEFAATAEQRLPRLNGWTKKDMSTLEAAMRYQDGIDLTLAVLTAYAYVASDFDWALPRLWVRTTHALRVAPLDIEMFLSRNYRPWIDKAGVMPPFPIHARGWSLMGAVDAQLPPVLGSLESHVEAAPWTTVDPEGVGMISEYISHINQSWKHLERIRSKFFTGKLPHPSVLFDMVSPKQADLNTETEEETW